MTEKGRKSNFALMDEMEKKHRMQAKDGTYIDPKPDGIRYIKKCAGSGLTRNWFSLWLYWADGSPCG